MNTKNFFLAGIAGVILASCTDDVVSENKAIVKDTDFLKVEVTDMLEDATTRADYSGFPSTTFEEDDAIGVYAFDGSSYVASNIRFVKQSDGSWLPDEEIPYNEDCTYYAYFPYSSSAYIPSTSGTLDAVDTKFASFISDANNYFWQANQSTKAGFTFGNLMIAKGTVTEAEGDAGTVKFMMKHKRGLAVFTNGAEYATFTGNIPYLVGNKMFFLMKPSVPTSFTDDFDTYSLSAASGDYVTHFIPVSGVDDDVFPLAVLFYNTVTGTKKVYDNYYVPDPSEGWIPIAIEVVPREHDRYGDGSGGFMALTCVKSDGSADTPTDVDQNDTQQLRWGPVGDTSLSNYGYVQGTKTQGYVFYQTNEKSMALSQNGSSSTKLAYPFTTSAAEEISVYSDGGISDYDGVGNSNVLNSSTYDAFFACKVYFTQGTYEGDWYLPALGELAYVPSIRYEINKTVQILNNIYGLLGRNISLDQYRSSTEKNDNYAYNVNMNQGNIPASTSKTTSYYVRPFLKFPMEEYDPGDGYVDLGLPSGTLLAKGNIVKDANGNYKMGKPTDSGCYFSWGNIIGHNVGEGYGFSDANYQGTQGYSVDTDIPSNDAQHDAALACLGLPWHMPTKDNFQELIDYTDSEWTTIDGINGRKFMKKTDHNVFIFLPANGGYDGTTLSYRGEYISLWTASRNNSNGYDYYMISGSSSIAIDDNSGRYGRCIRGVITP